MKIFKNSWSGHKMLVKCDNEAVITVLRSGKTKDTYLAAVARKVWYLASLSDIDIQYVHIRGAR